jgi:hypothetical protein
MMAYTTEQLQGMGPREVEERLSQLSRIDMRRAEQMASDPYYDRSVTQKYQNLITNTRLEKAQLLDRQEALAAPTPADDRAQQQGDGA